MTALTSLQPGEFHHQKGLAAIEAELLQDAVFEFREALRLDPGSAKTWNDLGVVMEALGNPSDAIQCYGRAIQADPEHEEALMNLTGLRLQIDMARALRRQAHLLEPTH